MIQILDLLPQRGETFKGGHGVAGQYLHSPSNFRLLVITKASFAGQFLGRRTVGAPPSSSKQGGRDNVSYF